MAGDLLARAIGALLDEEVPGARLLVSGPGPAWSVEGSLVAMANGLLADKEVLTTGVCDDVGSGLGFSGVASREELPAGEAWILLEVESALFLRRLDPRSWLAFSAWDMMVVMEGWSYLWLGVLSG